MEYLLIHKVANRFRFSGIAYQDLFQEACVAYLEAFPKYNEGRGALSTFLWSVMENRLRALLKKEKSLPETTESELFLPHQQTVLDKLLFIEAVEEAGSVPRIILEMVLANPGLYLTCNSPKAARGMLKKELRKKGISHPAIGKGFHQIKKALA